MKIYLPGLIAALAVVTWFGCVSTPEGRGFFIPHTNEQSGQITYTVNPGVTNAIGNAQAVAHDVPIPFANIAATVLGGATGLLTWIAKRKSDKAALVPALIAGVENAPNNAEVKSTIQRVAIEHGVERQLKREVQIHRAKALALGSK